MTADAASFDPITGVPDETSFRTGTRALLDGHPETTYLIGVLDIKDFKIINDLLGFNEGDRTLRYAGQELARAVEGKGTCGRLFSDHFAFCIPSDRLAAQHITQKAANRCSAFDVDFPLTVKFGFCEMDDRTLSVARAIDCALIALNSTKHSYFKRYAYYGKEMRKTMLKEASIAAEMHKALAERQFQVYFQPQYNHASDSLVGAEALVRWIHPSKGMIPPSDFIPVFEKNGFITQLDHFVWEEACRQLQTWKDQGIDIVPVSVNLSRLDIYDPDLPYTLSRLIEAYDLSYDLLKLEITESAYVESPLQLINVVGTLQKIGFTIEMDDFGSGHSSLNTLKDVPVDILKIDLAFLAGDHAGRGGNILQSVVRMARWLKLPVIAEGVENVEQADYLTSIGCEIVQGFYYAQPMPAKDFTNLLETLPVTRASDVDSLDSLMDLDEMWNHESQLTWFFDHVLDGSVIFDYHDDCLEPLRVNEEFYDFVDAKRKSFDVLPVNLLEAVEPAERGDLLDALSEVEFGGKSVVRRVHWRWPKEAASVGLILRMKLIIKTAQRSIFYTSIEPS